MLCVQFSLAVWLSDSCLGLGLGFGLGGGLGIGLWSGSGFGLGLGAWRRSVAGSVQSGWLAGGGLAPGSEFRLGLRERFYFYFTNLLM